MVVSPSTNKQPWSQKAVYAKHNESINCLAYSQSPVLFKFQTDVFKIY